MRYFWENAQFVQKEFQSKKNSKIKQWKGIKKNPYFGYKSAVRRLRNNYYNVGIVIPKGYICFDFETKSAFEANKHLFKPDQFIVHSLNGVHVYVKAPKNFRYKGKIAPDLEIHHEGAIMTWVGSTVKNAARVVTYTAGTIDGISEARVHRWNTRDTKDIAGFQQPHDQKAIAAKALAQHYESMKRGSSKKADYVRSRIAEIANLPEGRRFLDGRRLMIHVSTFQHSVDFSIRDAIIEATAHWNNQPKVRALINDCFIYGSSLSNPIIFKKDNFTDEERAYLNHLIDDATEKQWIPAKERLKGFHACEYARLLGYLKKIGKSDFHMSVRMISKIMSTSLNMAHIYYKQLQKDLCLVQKGYIRIGIKQNPITYKTEMFQEQQRVASRWTILPKPGNDRILTINDKNNNHIAQFFVYDAKHSKKQESGIGYRTWIDDYYPPVWTRRPSEITIASSA